VNEVFYSLKILFILQKNAFTCVAKVLKDVIKDDQKKRQFNSSWGEYFHALIEKTLTTENIKNSYSPPCWWCFV